MYATLYEPQSWSQWSINNNFESLKLFDNSDYPKDHMCYNSMNKKVIGMFKDEAGVNRSKSLSV